MGCCSCFGITRKTEISLRPAKACSGNWFSHEFLLGHHHEDTDDESPDMQRGCDGKLQRQAKCSEDILSHKFQNGLTCREVPVKETHRIIRTEDEDGNKMVNEYVRERKIGCGSYGKVVLYRSKIDGKQYAIKAFHKSHLFKMRVAPSETAMTDVLREVMIMKLLEHPNIVNLIEVIDDPSTDHFYMVLEYVDGKPVCEGSDPSGVLEESTARKYLRDIVAGLLYLHAHSIVHGDIKPDNLLVTNNGNMKIGDFSVSQAFEENNDELRRSPGTPAFTAPECCFGLTYHGKASDTWALGVTLYRMVVGQYPFLGDTLQDTYDKIVSNPIEVPKCVNPELKNLIEGLLCKDPDDRMTLSAIAEHPWVIEEEGPLPQFLCRCKRNSSRQDEHQQP